MRRSSASFRLLVLSVLFLPLCACGTLMQCDNKRFAVPKDMREDKNRIRRNKAFAVPALWKAKTPPSPPPKATTRPSTRPSSKPAPLSPAAMKWEPTWGHHSGLRGAAFSPDGTFALTAESHRQVIQWSLPSMKVKRRWHGFVASLKALSLSSDGRRFAVLEGRSTVSVWSIDGSLLKRTRFPKALTSLQFATVENKIAVTLASGELVMLRGSSLEAASQSKPCKGGVGAVLLFEPLQSWLMVSCKKGGLALVKGGRVSMLLAGIPVTRLAYASKGHRVAVGDASGRVHLLAQKEGEWKVESRGLAHLRPITALGFASDGKRLVSAGADLRLSFWTLTSAGLKLKEWKAVPSALGEVFWFDQDRRILGGDQKGRLSVRNSGGEVFQKIDVAPTVSFHASFSLRGHRLALSGTKGAFTVWDLKTLQPLMSSTRQTAALLSLQFAVDGNHLLSVDPYNAVFWDVRSQILVDIVPLDKGALFSAASLGSDWTEAWLGTAQHGVQWWTIRGGPTPLFRHSKPQNVSTVTFQRLLRLGAAGTAGGKVYLYALRKDERRLLVSKRLSKQSIHQLVFHPKKTELAVISGGAIAIVDKKLKPLATVIHHNTIQTAHFSPDGATLAFAGEEGDVLLWERKSRKLIRRFKGCKGMIRAVTFAPAAPIVAGACTDGFVYLWNRTNSSPLAQLATLPNKEWLVRIQGNRFLGSQKAPGYFRLRKGEQLFPVIRWGQALFAKDAGKETMKAVLSPPKAVKR